MGNELLVWARDTGLEIALIIFIAGTLLRLIEIFALGRKADLSPPRRRPGASGWWTMLRRTAPSSSVMGRSALTVVMGYVFHIGFFVVLLLFLPHIELFEELIGLSWPGLPTPIVDATAVITMIAMVAVLANRMTDPVKRFLSGFGDYLAWGLTLLPLITGYLAFHHLLLPYTTMLALHILSAELLLAALPFTKLIHAVTTWPARWYNGEIQGRKGVQS